MIEKQYLRGRWKREIRLITSTGAFLSHERFTSFPSTSTRINPNAEPTPPPDCHACSEGWMIPVKPITTCEFIPLLQRCKPPTGWPQKLGMNATCSINDHADITPF